MAPHLKRIYLEMVQLNDWNQLQCWWRTQSTQSDEGCGTKQLGAYLVLTRSKLRRSPIGRDTHKGSSQNDVSIIKGSQWGQVKLLIE